MYKDYQFLGTADWAVSLQSYGMYDGRPDNQQDEDWWNVQPSAPLEDCRLVGKIDSLLRIENWAIMNPNLMPAHCMPEYVIDALKSEMKTNKATYDRLLEGGYDRKFYAYADTQGDESAAKNITGFLEKRGNEFFTCRIEELTYCCGSCSWMAESAPPQDGCRNCHNEACMIDNEQVPGMSKRTDLELFANDTQALSFADVRKREQINNMIPKVVDEPCPPDYSQRGWGNNKPFRNKIWWKLKPDKSEAFWKAIVADTGVPSQKIKLGDTDIWFGGPIAVVVNPKDVVQAAMAKHGEITAQLEDAARLFKYNAYEGDPAAYLDAITLPVAMVTDAVKQMSKIDEIGEKIEEQKKKQIIIAVFSALLFFIPIAGQVVGSVAGMSGLAALAVSFGVIGDIAMGAYTLINEKDNPVGGILQIVLAPAALFDLPAIARASQLRRGMDTTALTKLGRTVETSAHILQKAYGVCKKL